MASRHYVTVLIAQIIVALPFQAGGQSIGGKVVDAGSAAPIAGAAVELLQLDAVLRVVVTDSTGAFRFLLRSPGEYSIRARALGFEVFRGSRLVVGDGEFVDVVVRMATQPMPVDTLFVNARRQDPRRLATYEGFLCQT